MEFCGISETYIIYLQVTWKSPAGSIISLNDKLFQSERKYQVEQPYHYEWNLRIINSRSEDSGVYSCQVNTKPQQTSLVHLHVKGRSGQSMFILSTTKPQQTSTVHLHVKGRSGQSMFILSTTKPQQTRTVHLHVKGRSGQSK